MTSLIKIAIKYEIQENTSRNCQVEADEHNFGCRLSTDRMGGWELPWHRSCIDPQHSTQYTSSPHTFVFVSSFVFVLSSYSYFSSPCTHWTNWCNNGQISQDKPSLNLCNLRKLASICFQTCFQTKTLCNSGFIPPSVQFHIFFVILTLWPLCWWLQYLLRCIGHY